MKKIEILMIGPGDTESVSGGIVTVIKGLVNELKNDFFINYIVTMRPVSVYKRLYIYVFSIFSIIGSLFNRNQKIAHVHMSIKTSFYRKAILIVILKFFNIPIIIHLHSGEFHIFYKKNLSSFMKKVAKYIFSLADKVILLTNSWEKWYIKTIGLDNSLVIYNGVKCLYNHDSKLIKDRENYVLFLGKLGENKGIYDLLHAFKEVLTTLPNAQLKIGGDGEVNLCKKLAKELNISSNLSFLGWIGEKEKRKLLNEVKLYILPSYNEGLPMGVLEAMSAGIGVITTPVGGIPEAIENNKNGILVKEGSVEEIANAITTLLSDNEKNTALGLEAKKTYHEKFEIKNVANQVKELYYELSKKSV